MSDHILVLTDQEVNVLGALYSLGAMTALAKGDDKREAQAATARDLTATMFETLPSFGATQRVLRDRIFALVQEAGSDAERENISAD